MAEEQLEVSRWEDDVLRVVSYLAQCDNFVPPVFVDEQLVLEVAEFMRERNIVIPPELAELHPLDLLPLPEDPYMERVVMAFYLDAIHEYTESGDMLVAGHLPTLSPEDDGRR